MARRAPSLCKSSGVMLIDLNFQQLDHRQILRAGDRAERHDRRGRTVAPEQLAQRQSAADGVGIGIMLQQDVDLLAFVEQRADALDFLDIESVEQLSGAKLGENIGELQVAQQRIVGFFRSLFAVFFRGQGNDRDIFVEGAQQAADPILFVSVTDKNHRLIDMVQFDFLVGLFF